MAPRVRLDNYAVAAVPRLGLTGWLRWIWRQVTSMRVALLLLLLLALAAIPGSLLPQRPRDPVGAAQYIVDHPEWGPWLQRVGLLDVFGSAWFTAIYVLLFLSLIGCVVPRAIAHARSARKPIPSAPSSLERYAARAQAPTGDPRAAIAAVASHLRGSRPWARLTGYRVRVEERAGAGNGRELALSADNGALREYGNLVFHTSLVGVLVAILVSSFVTYRGQAIVVEGHAFTNSVIAYDSFSGGRGFRPEALEPFTLRLDEFTSEFGPTGRPLDFQAHVTLTEPGRAAAAASISVNHPLHIAGTDVFLQGNGFAPDLIIRDADGNIAFAGPIPFLPQDAAYTSTGVVKVPDVTSGPQIGLRATLLPTAAVEGGTAVSIYPTATNPVIIFTAFAGDLGLDEGIPQNVYTLDDTHLSPVRGDDGQPETFVLTPGSTVDLPDGLGSVTWAALPHFVALDVHADPAQPYMLIFALLALTGLTVSLFAPRRRVWVTVPLARGDTVVTAAAHGPEHDEGLEALAHRVAAAASGIRVEDT